MNGTPVDAATVYAVAQDNALDGITPRSVKTDANGEFDFRGGFQLGAYKVYSRKDADAYPDRSDSFYADSKTEAPKVDLTPPPLALYWGRKLGSLRGELSIPTQAQP